MNEGNRKCLILGTQKYHFIHFWSIRNENFPYCFPPSWKGGPDTRTHLAGCVSFVIIIVYLLQYSVLLTISKTLRRVERRPGLYLRKRLVLLHRWIDGVGFLPPGVAFVRNCRLFGVFGGVVGESWKGPKIFGGWSVSDFYFIFFKTISFLSLKFGTSNPNNKLISSDIIKY